MNDNQISFTVEHLAILREARNILISKVDWRNSPGGDQARIAHDAIDELLKDSEDLILVCPVCGRKRD